VPKSCPANPRTEWALRGAGPVTFSLTAVRAARAARGTLWPLAPPPCHVGSKPAGRGSLERRTEASAAGRGLNWSRRGQGPPLKLSSGPCRLVTLKDFCVQDRSGELCRIQRANPEATNKGANRTCTRIHICLSCHDSSMVPSGRMHRSIRPDVVQ
jgi:hypothetical protein